MMFHSALFLACISLTSGVALLVWALRNGGAGVGIAKAFGVLVVLFSILGFLCTVYDGMKRWRSGDMRAIPMYNNTIVPPMYDILSPCACSQNGTVPCSCARPTQEQLDQKNQQK